MIKRRGPDRDSEFEAAPLAPSVLAPLSRSNYAVVARYNNISAAVDNDMRPTEF